ncbi:MAG: hypothetical protein JSV62_13350 [Promethearchaeota archaeon]|nr:MAG: hypothetical protein JSV62_13350 [Candidatus Lokiarchaeota archaeon]
MSIDKWLDDKDSKEERIKREKAFKQLSKEEVQQLKKKKIREMIKKEDQKPNEISAREKILQQIVEFKDWLNQRTYLKGDFERIEMWIKNLYSLINLVSNQEEKSAMQNEKNKIIKRYKEIPPKFLDEKIRVAVNKLIYGTKRTNSDNYYLRKLRNDIKEKLKEAEYYDILNKLIKIL